MSLTYKGVVVSVIAWVFTRFGVPFVEGNIEVTIETILSLVGVLVTLYGRYRVGGITAFGGRK